MKKFNAKGFGAIEVLLMVVIVGIIGGAGYHIYHSQKKANTALDNAAKSQSEPQKAEKAADKDMVRDWAEFKSADGAYSIKVPDGWELFRGKDNANIHAHCFSTIECVTYKEGTKGTVNTTEGGRGGPFRFALTQVLEVNNLEALQRGNKVNYNSAGAHATEKFVFTQTKEEPMDVPVGGKEYSYYIKKDNKVLKITYSIFNTDEKDESTIVDSMVATLKL